MTDIKDERLDEKLREATCLLVDVAFKTSKGDTKIVQNNLEDNKLFINGDEYAHSLTFVLKKTREGSEVVEEDDNKKDNNKVEN